MKYDVDLPEQAKPGWKGEVLQEPSLKVPSSSMMHRFYVLTLNRSLVVISSNAMPQQLARPSGV